MAKILVVDDEPAIVTFVTKILEAHDHQLISATDGKAALDAAREHTPDIIILDVNLPKLDGYEVCKTLKSEDATKHIPIIMMTAAYTTVEDAQQGEDYGADEYVIKPFLREVLLHNVERWLPKA